MAGVPRGPWEEHETKAQRKKRQQAEKKREREEQAAEKKRDREALEEWARKREPKRRAL